MVEVEQWGEYEVDEGGLLWLVGQLFAKTFEALQPLTALASPKGRIAVSSQNLATNFNFFFEGYAYKKM